MACLGSIVVRQHCERRTKPLSRTLSPLVPPPSQGYGATSRGERENNLGSALPRAALSDSLALGYRQVIPKRGFRWAKHTGVRPENFAAPDKYKVSPVGREWAKAGKRGSPDES